jgi:DNA-binding response OmpR family regulator
MPGMDGLDVIGWMRARTLKARVLLLTGDVLTDETDDFIRSNGIVCLNKPFRVQELLHAVSEILGVSSPAVT